MRDPRQLRAPVSHAMEHGSAISLWVPAYALIEVGKELVCGVQVTLKHGHDIGPTSLHTRTGASTPVNTAAPSAAQPLVLGHIAPVHPTWDIPPRVTSTSFPARSEGY